MRCSEMLGMCSYRAAIRAEVWRYVAHMGDRPSMGGMPGKVSIRRRVKASRSHTRRAIFAAPIAKRYSRR